MTTPTFHQPLTSYITTTLPTMDGWCTPEKATHLANLTLTHRPHVCLEIGVYAGRSFFAVALALKQLGHGRLLGIDPWNAGASIEGFSTDPANRDWWLKLDHGAIYQQFEHYRQQLGVATNTDIFLGTSRQASRLLAWVHACNASAPFIDLLHIDGNHSVENALADVNEYVPLVRGNGIVVMDDTNWATTKPAQQRLDELCSTVQMVDQGDKGAYGVYKRKP